MSIKTLFTQQPGEKIEFVLRRHPIVFAGPVFVFIILALIPLIGKEIFLEGQPLAFSNPLAQAGIVLLLVTYYLGIWVFFLSQFTDYYLDINIVTNDRIIDINQKGLFGRSIAELDLTRVQDVHSEIKGIIPTLLGYGYVTVQTASNEENFHFEQVPNPNAIRQRILELAALDRKREAREIMGTNPAAAGHREMKEQGL
ncbi:MAG: PH domain-containing protein [Patescibacteria group bacterium]|nr:MAG: PH domain-containing protein [Patescibacteria group bacterium]